MEKEPFREAKKQSQTNQCGCPCCWQKEHVNFISCTVHTADTQCCEAGVTGICSTEPTQNTWKEVNHRRKGRQDKITDSVSKALQATITSRYVKESPNTEPADPCVLTGVVPIDKLVLYVGSINSGCNAHSIRDWCEARDVEVLNCSVMESKYLGT